MVEEAIGGTKSKENGNKNHNQGLERPGKQKQG